MSGTADLYPTTAEFYLTTAEFYPTTAEFYPTTAKIYPTTAELGNMLCKRPPCSDKSRIHVVKRRSRFS